MVALHRPAIRHQQRRIEMRKTVLTTIAGAALIAGSGLARWKIRPAAQMKPRVLLNASRAARLTYANPARCKAHPGAVRQPPRDAKPGRGSVRHGTVERWSHRAKVSRVSHIVSRSEDQTSRDHRRWESSTCQPRRFRSFGRNPRAQYREALRCSC